MAIDEPLRVALIGVHGYGQVHLDGLLRLAGTGAVRVAGLADPRPPAPESLARVRALPGGADVPVLADAAELLERVRPDVTIVSTPIHTHLPLARLALAAGSHLLLEKPPTASMAQFRELSAEVAGAGKVCQVGFQSFGSRALAHAARLVADGALGPLRGVGVHGAWVRERAYFARAAWAGRMELDGVPVTDGALTNAFAHATASALRVAGVPAGADVGVELQRYRVASPEGDDTASVRLTVGGIPIVVAVTLCAAEHRMPVIVVHGERGRLELEYTTDTLTGRTADGAEVGAPPGREVLLDNLVAHLHDPAVPLLCPLADCEPFMHLLEAVRRDGPARAMPPAAVEEIDGRPVVVGVDDLVRRCAEDLTLFAELPAPWS
ncbi:Gfo/Idh/MocA family protein [Pseudonocardia kunmingensis]|uniref:Putative dehydrogenase n=1 Tax=Pseudonocardia kunmingensis TaxID=630975 RepID=A0A543DWW1_9PSEU|nr:Gfo/Idh/MocA family oxidoreductase [Pseudonocardia kunmingensis]TQM13830.1 putative dehydrogenase [Pseudonocardia kunmingensis]